LQIMATSPLKVLVIDDMAGVRESLRAALQAAGHDVTTANDGREGLAALADGTFDIVVTDIWMPEIDGLNVIKRIRAERSHLRVFAMTGGGPRLTIEAAGSIAEVWGAERVFVKPFDEAALVAALRD
jgi:two-component system chemotaxis response regulator CheY